MPSAHDDGVGSRMRHRVLDSRERRRATAVVALATLATCIAAPLPRAAELAIEKLAASCIAAEHTR